MPPLFALKARYREIVFTYNNPPPLTAEGLAQTLKTSFLIIGREVGESGTPHLQGYCEWKDAKTGSAIKKKLPTCHLETRMGTAAQAADYCQKDGNFEMWGNMSVGKGKRTDLHAVRDAIIAGNSNFRDVCQDYPNVSAQRTAATLLTYFERPRRFKPVVIWLWGDCGVGKTKRAMELAYAYTKDLEQIKVIGESAKWWDGYDAHKAVLFEEVTNQFCSWKRMLMLLDRYECQVEVKGGMRQLRSRYMFITSSVPPENIWSTNENVEQLLRRIDHIQEIKSWTHTIYHKGDPDALPTPCSIPEDEEEDDHAEEAESVDSSETVRS